MGYRAIDGACKDHNELRRLKKRGLGKRNTFTYENTDKDNLQWKLHWEDEGDKCQLKCQDVFKRIFEHDKCKIYESEYTIVLTMYR